MDIAIYDKWKKQLALREKLVEIEEARKAGVPDFDAKSVGKEFVLIVKGSKNKL